MKNKYLLVANVILGVIEFREDAVLIIVEFVDIDKLFILVLASSWAFKAAMAVAAFGSGGGIGFPNLVCNFTT